MSPDDAARAICDDRTEIAAWQVENRLADFAWARTSDDAWESAHGVLLGPGSGRREREIEDVIDGAVAAAKEA